VAGCWQVEHDGESAAGGRLEPDLTALRLDEAAGDGQAQPDPGMVGVVTQALERLEDPLPVLGWDAGPVIDHA